MIVTYKRVRIWKGWVVSPTAGLDVEGRRQASTTHSRVTEVSLKFSVMLSVTLAQPFLEAVRYFRHVSAAHLRNSYTVAGGGS
jgi:hypothetical protein